MNDWDATSYAAKDNLLRVVRREADALFQMAEGSDSWTALLIFADGIAELFSAKAMLSRTVNGG